MTDINNRLSGLEVFRSRIYGAYVSARPDASAGTEEVAARKPYLARLVRQHFPRERNAAVIDLGCGSGTLIEIAKAAGYENIRGVDRSPEQVGLAVARGLRNVEQADLLATLTSLPARSQDVVVSFDVVEHFTKGELLTFADEVARVLKIGGRWIIHVPNAEAPFGARIRYADLTHELVFPPNSIAQLLHTVGFAEVRCYEDAPVPHGVKSCVRWLLWKVIRGALRLYLAAETGDTGGRAVFSQNLLAVGLR